jgi:hypothetical protein
MSGKYSEPCPYCLAEKGEPCRWDCLPYEPYKASSDCSNEFYLEFANCETCTTKILVDQEFNTGEQIKFNCSNCGDGNTLQM